MGPGGLAEWRVFDTAAGLYDCAWSEVWRGRWEGSGLCWRGQQVLESSD